MRLAAAYDQFCVTTYARLRRALTPQLRNSQYEYADALRMELQRRGHWLDIGCGHEFLPTWMNAEGRAISASRWTVVGIDLDRNAIARHSGLNGRVQGDAQCLPFCDDTFDLVTANMVFEHVADPEALFQEVSRVLRRGGRMLIHTPNAEGYTTRLTRLIPAPWLKPLASVLLSRKDGIYPTFYRANSLASLRSFAQRSQMQVDSFRFINSSPQLIRVPPLMTIELVCTRWFARDSMKQYRACILATFEKPSVG
jgi:ubiquinone/menaquinone biosynthesis C-methylase UbiE